MIETFVWDVPISHSMAFGGPIVRIVWGGELTGRKWSFLVRAIVALLAGNTIVLLTHNPATSTTSASEQRDDTAAVTTSSTSSPAVPPSGSTSAPGPTTDSTAPPGPPGQRATTTTTSFPFPIPKSSPGDYVYKVTLEPTCIRAGDELTITFGVKPRSNVSFVAVYAVHETKETVWGETSHTGMSVHTWRAPPAPGDGIVYTLASEASDLQPWRTGTKAIPFRIVTDGNSC